MILLEAFPCCRHFLEDLTFAIDVWFSSFYYPFRSGQGQVGGVSTMRCHEVDYEIIGHDMKWLKWSLTHKRRSSLRPGP